MISVLVLTHGELARELLDAACMIDSHLSERSSALSLPWDIDSDEASRQLKRALRELDQGEGVLILTDMFGGTATNLALPFLDADRVEVITGTNLPMLVKLASLRGLGLPVHEMAERLTTAGQKSIRVASEFLKRREPS